MRVLIVIVAWVSLSVLSGTGLAALGAGSLSPMWLAFSSGFCGLFFSPILLIAFED
jgi:hypothetical protein